MKSILLYANDDQAVNARLGAAIDLAHDFDAHLTCLQVTPFDRFVLADPFGGIYAMPAMLDHIRAIEDAHRAHVEARLEREGVTWDWQHYDGAPAQLIVDRSRLADIVVLSLPSHDRSILASPIGLTGDVALHARSPVLAIPPSVDRFDCRGTAIIAWNGSPESAHALRFSLPLLQKARAIHVVTITDDRTDFPSIDACEYLARHGLSAELTECLRDGRPVAEALLQCAADRDGGYIVAGAYGHLRLREAVLGGVTRGLLGGSDLPLLLGH